MLFTLCIISLPAFHLLSISLFPVSSLFLSLSLPPSHPLSHTLIIFLTPSPPICITLPSCFALLQLQFHPPRSSLFLSPSPFCLLSLPPLFTPNTHPQDGWWPSDLSIAAQVSAHKYRSVTGSSHNFSG